MIEIDATLDKAGLLKSCTVKGHANAGSKGADIVCAAVSVLVRTAWKVLSERNEGNVHSDAPDRGVFFLEVDTDTVEKKFLSAVSAFLLEGLESVAVEYPNHCKITYRRS